ncbi:PTS sugar transporter subunit IIA [Micrococcales bacterium 31B]|nr:PTS sugar transporter subunit IIA [Micrococcales bacterium 31B]
MSPLGADLRVDAALALPSVAFAGEFGEQIYGAASPREALLDHLGCLAVNAGYARPSLPRALVARERQHPTGIPSAVPCALPHTDASHVLRPAIGLAVLPQPVEFMEMGSASRTVAARLVVMILVQNSLDQVDTLQAILGAVGDAEAAAPALAATTPEELASAFSALLAP